MLLKPCNTYIWLLIKGGLILTKSDFYEKTNKYIIMLVEPIIILYNNVYIWYYKFLSAGVGRSGTYITIDAMLQRLKDEDTLNIYEFVTKCRTRRTFMVQNQVITIVIYTYVRPALRDLMAFLSQYRTSMCLSMMLSMTT